MAASNNGHFFKDQKFMKNLISSLLIALLFSLSISSCQDSKSPELSSGAEYSEQIKKIIEEKNAKIETWYAAGLIDSVASHFAEDCIQLPPNQPPIIGNENFKEVWNQNIQIGQWDFDLRTEKVKASGDLATEYGTYTLSFTPNENSPIPAMTDHGSYVVLWEKIDQEWKVLWDAPVSNLPLPGAGPELSPEE